MSWGYQLHSDGVSTYSAETWAVVTKFREQFSLEISQSHNFPSSKQSLLAKREKDADAYLVASASLVESTDLIRASAE